MIMDSFVSRKRRKLSPSPDKSDRVNLQEDDDDSTDLKLALLASLNPHMEQQVLLDILLAHEGSVEAASTSLLFPEDSSLRKTPSVPGYQSSLASFAIPSDTSKRPKLLSKKGKTLYLYSPEDVAAHTPCSIIHNFLPTKDANELLEELLLEAPSFEKLTFKLFDNVVSSPHTSAFYVETLEEVKRQKTEYLYNGDRLTDVRQITPVMRRIASKVQDAVNSEVNSRIKSHYPDGKKLKHQSPHPWTPNAAFVNCYAGGNESVGYHSDQLTYLGPRAIIGSISLGVAREFRVRRIIPQEPDTNTTTNPPSPTSLAASNRKYKEEEEARDASGQISIHLPHNSLLVMHAEMQESWKHSIAPAAAIDPHPRAGNRRLNITYRDYKAALHPSRTPQCRCGVPTVLRVVQRRRETCGRYFWMCHAGNVPGKQGCTFFQWAEFDEDGNPIWKGSAAAAVGGGNEENDEAGREKGKRKGEDEVKGGQEGGSP